MKSFFTGLGLGAGIGLLLAPEAGSQTRERLKGKFTDPKILVGRSGNSLIEAATERTPQLAQDESKAEEQPSDSNAQPAKMEQDGSEDAPLADILNTASKTKLMSVPGIGDATARRIIENKPYDQSNVVLEKNVLSEEIMRNLRRELPDKEEAV
jgi:DNA uptake protein ComE-like DNA-binding protein